MIFLTLDAMSDIILSVFGLKLDCKNIIFIELATTHLNFHTYATVRMPANPV